MKTKQTVLVVGLTSLAFLITVSQGIAALGEPEKAIKEHIEQITTGTHFYEITMGGTLDEFNTAGYFDT